jgi:hypothetical protein
MGEFDKTSCVHRSRVFQEGLADILTVKSRMFMSKNKNFRRQRGGLHRRAFAPSFEIPVWRTVSCSVVLRNALYDDPEHLWRGAFSVLVQSYQHTSFTLLALFSGHSTSPEDYASRWGRTAFGWIHPLVELAVIFIYLLFPVSHMSSAYHCSCSTYLRQLWEVDIFHYSGPFFLK